MEWLVFIEYQSLYVTQCQILYILIELPWLENREALPSDIW